MDPIVVTLRASKSPAPSAAVGGEISGPEYDATITALKTAAEQLDAEKLAISSAPTITATKPVPVGADRLMMFDSEVVGTPPVLVTMDDFLAGVVAEPAVAPLLGSWDWWYYSRIGNSNIAANDMFLGAAISSGTNTTAIPSDSLGGFNNYGVFLRSGTTANGGYRYQTSSLVSDYFGTISHKFRGQFLWRTAFTGRTVRMGYLDTNTSADAVDGAYFEIAADVCSAKTANNSTRTTNATTVTLSLDVAYTFDIEVNAAGTSARFRVYAGTTEAPILDVTNTTNIPTTSARAFGSGVVATESSTTASDIGILYGIGAGTVEGFQSQNVSQILGDIETILASI